MTVHMIRVYSAPPKTDAHFQRMRRVCENWAMRYDETLKTDRMGLTHTTPSAWGDMSASEHAMGQWRFAWHEDRAQLLSDLEAPLRSEVGWLKILYHSCDHDESTPTGCEWDETETREYGSVPGDL